MSKSWQIVSSLSWDKLTNHHSAAPSEFSHDRLSWQLALTVSKTGAHFSLCSACGVSAAPPWWPCVISKQTTSLFAFIRTNVKLTYVYFVKLQDLMQPHSYTSLFGQNLHAEAFTYYYCVFCLDLQFCSEGITVTRIIKCFPLCTITP